MSPLHGCLSRVGGRRAAGADAGGLEPGDDGHSGAHGLDGGAWRARFDQQTQGSLKPKQKTKTKSKMREQTVGEVICSDFNSTGQAVVPGRAEVPGALDTRCVSRAPLLEFEGVFVQCSATPFRWVGSQSKMLMLVPVRPKQVQELFPLNAPRLVQPCTYLHHSQLLVQECYLALVLLSHKAHRVGYRRYAITAPLSATVLAMR